MLTMNPQSLMYGEAEHTFLYASFPEINDLHCTICKIDFIEVHDSRKSNFYWQTVKCRLLIHLSSDIIASPVTGTENYIFVITRKTYVESKKLDKILRNFKLVYQGSRPVTPQLYKTCLLFAIQTKIAPFWKKIGDYLVQENNFFNSVGAHKAVMLDVLIDEKITRMQCFAANVQISYIKLENYLPSAIISQFLADPDGYIDLQTYNLPFIRVLPSTKQGKLLSVSKKLPRDSIFKDYQQLRRYWKNMYGYSLPTHEENILYYEIKFLIPRSKIFTYPNICLLNSPLDIISTGNKESIIADFVCNLLASFSAICGKQLEISKHKPINTNSCSTVVLQESKEENAYLEEVVLAENVEKNTNDSNATSKSTNTSNNTFSPENITNLTSRNSKQDEIQCLDTAKNPSTQSSKLVFKENYVGKNAHSNIVVRKKEAISGYFNLPESCASIDKGEASVERDQDQLTLKEKLFKAKHNKNIRVPLQGMDYNVNVEAMAKSNQLEHLTVRTLSEWLKRNSIPHNTRGKKTELINKILSHIRNTEILHQYRM